MYVGRETVCFFDVCFLIEPFTTRQTLFASLSTGPIDSREVWLVRKTKRERYSTEMRKGVTELEMNNRH